MYFQVRLDGKLVGSEWGLCLCCWNAVFCFNPLRHVLGAFMVVMTQHAAGKVIASKLCQVLLAIQQLFDQRRTMYPIVDNDRPAMPALGIGRPSTEPCPCTAEPRNRRTHCAVRVTAPGHGCSPCIASAPIGVVIIRRATQHGVDNFAFDAGTKAQGGQTHPCRQT